MDPKYVIMCLAYASPILPVFAGWKRKRLLWWFVVVGIGFEIAGLILKPRGFNVLVLANLFFLTEFIFLAVYYRDQIFRSRRQFSLVISGLLLLYFITWEYTGLTALNAFGSTVFFFVYIIFSVSGFYRLLADKKVTYLERSAFFWVNVSVLVYATGNILLFLFDSYLLQANKALLILMWMYFHNGLTVIRNLLFAVAFTKKNEL